MSPEMDQWSGTVPLSSVAARVGPGVPKPNFSKNLVLHVEDIFLKNITHSPAFRKITKRMRSLPLARFILNIDGAYRLGLPRGRVGQEGCLSVPEHPPAPSSLEGTKFRPFSQTSVKVSPRPLTARSPSGLSFPIGKTGRGAHSDPPPRLSRGWTPSQILFHLHTTCRGGNTAPDPHAALGGRVSKCE